MSTADEAAFLATYSSASFPKPSVTVDVVILTISDGALRTLLVKRTERPAAGHMALPGGFVRMDEDLDAAASRILADKAGLRNVFLEQLYTFGRPDRDPRTRIISVAYYALVESAKLVASTLDPHAELVAIENKAPTIPVAFDHADIVRKAVTRLRGKLNYTPLVYALLPPEFTLLQLQHVHESILGSRINKDSFHGACSHRANSRKRRLYKPGEVDHRPAALYRASQRLM